MMMNLPLLALDRVLDLVPLQKGQQILDVATGTGIVALAGAERVGTKGKVIGVDLTPRKTRKILYPSGENRFSLILILKPYN